MNPSLLGAAGATLCVVLWLLTRRRPRPFLRSADTSAVAALNRAQLELVRPAPATGSAASAGRDAAPAGAEPAVVPLLPAAADARGRRSLLRRLAAQAAGNPEERLQAMRIARRWRHPSVLPLLRRGLRDVHPAVVAEAARAIAVYRGRPVATSPARKAQSASRPRRVSRTR